MPAGRVIEHRKSTRAQEVVSVSPSLARGGLDFDEKQYDMDTTNSLRGYETRLYLMSY